MTKEYDDELSNDISIAYVNDSDHWQFQLSDNPYGKNKLMQINGCILTSIYFDTVKIDIDFIDNSNSKNKEVNEAYLNIHFYTDGVKDKTTDLTLLINKTVAQSFN